MSTTTAIRQTLRRENARLDDQLRQVGLSVDTYRALRFAFRAVAISTIVATAILPEASLPPTGYLVLGGLALGPDVAEAYLSHNGN